MYVMNQKAEILNWVGAPSGKVLACNYLNTYTAKLNRTLVWGNISNNLTTFLD